MHEYFSKPTMSAAPTYRSPIEKPNNITYFGLFILFAYMTTSYLYFLPTGGPQLSDFVMAFGLVIYMGVHFINNSLRLTQTHFVVIAFAGLTVVINVIHFMSYPDFQFILSGLYYVYNGLIFIFITFLFRAAPRATLSVLYQAVALSMIIQVVYIQFFPNLEIGRVQGSFHNPNQLSYWALFSACIFILLRTRDRMSGFDLLVVLGFTYIQTVAISKAGLIAFALLIATLPFTRMLSSSYKTAMMLVSIVAALFIMFSFAAFYETLMRVENVQNVVERIDNIGQEKDDTLRWRGYYRLIEHWEYIIVGAGEGAYERFTDTPEPVEIHSAIANIIFSYGFFGFLIFSFFLFAVYKNAPKYFWVVLLVILMNGLAHQNMRFSHFWIVLATAYGMRYVSREEKEPRMHLDFHRPFETRNM